MNIINIIDDDGNVVSCAPPESVNINFVGDGNKVILHKDLRISNLNMLLGNNMTIKISKSIHKLDNISIGGRFSNGGGVIIGENCSFVSCQFMLNEDAYIKVGKDCMFSAGIKIWGSDQHGLVDLDTNTIINKSDGISIGNHVWICENVRILKNTRIADNSVCANSAVCTGKYDEKNVVIAGNPAKVIKRNIDWRRESPMIKQ